MTHTPETTARTLHASGFSFLMLRINGSKAPCEKWEHLKDRRPTAEEIEAWFGGGKTRGIGAIMGRVSGNAETIDFDDLALFEPYCQLVESKAPGLIARLVRVDTPRPGRQLVYRCAVIGRNQKLAAIETAATPEQIEAKHAYQNDAGEWLHAHTLIETRGEGGYVVAVGSPARVHKTARPYAFGNLDYSQTPTITPEEREILLAAARSFDEVGTPENADAEDRPRQKRERKDAEILPGDDFNERGDVAALLTAHGWQYSHDGKHGQAWTRPGKDINEGTSATLFPNGNFYVFSTNAHPLKVCNGHAYSPFALKAILDHAGVFEAAAKALVKEGYGAPDKKKAAKKKAAKKTTSPGDGEQKTLTAAGLRFRVEDDRVVAENEDGIPKVVCSRLEIVAATRDDSGTNWGRLLRFPDPDQRIHTWAMPSSLLSGDRAGFESVLRDMGLRVFDPRLLRYYLDGDADKRVLCVSKTGWHRGAFVFPSECIGAPDGEEIFHQSSESANYLMRTAGTGNEWREHVGRFAVGNSRLSFGISVAFAASLVEKLEAESGGFHFRGTTSEGKSTVLYAAGSVWGGGSDKGFLRRWRATINGLESVGESHNDALLCLDEIAEVDPREAGEVAYMLANGQGKIRQTKMITARRAPEWRLLFLSTGEISLADHMASVGKRVRGGMLVRLADLPADAGVGFGLFEELHGMESPKVFADTVSANARKYYGTPIREFLRKLVEQDGAELRQAWKTFKADFLTKNCPAKARPEVGRVCDRFALPAFAGEMASEASITGWKEGEATNAAAAMFKVWLGGRGTSDGADEAAMIAQVRAFIEKHGASRFQRLTPPDERGTIVDRAGLIEVSENGAVYYFFPEVFRSDVCRGYDPGAVVKALHQQQALLSNHGYQFKKWNPDASKMTPFYAVTDAILDGE